MGQELSFSRGSSQVLSLALQVRANPNEADPFLRLEKIRAATKGRAQLVLHGTNTFPDATMQNCIKGGMTRCNVNDLVLHTYSKYVAENTGKVPLTELMGKGTDLIQELIEYQMDVMGSAGKGDVLY
jgi:fructose-bisphosphate aldolase class II